MCRFVKSKVRPSSMGTANRKQGFVTLFRMFAGICFFCKKLIFNKIKPFYLFSDVTQKEGGNKKPPHLKQGRRLARRACDLERLSGGTMLKQKGPPLFRSSPIGTLQMSYARSDRRCWHILNSRSIHDPPLHFRQLEYTF